MQKEDELLDVQQVADLLHVNPRTVLRMADRNELTALKVGKRWRFRLRDLDAYLRRHLHTATPAQNTRYDALLNSEIDKLTHDERYTHSSTLREARPDYLDQQPNFDTGLEEPQEEKAPVLTFKGQVHQEELQRTELQKQETLLIMEQRQLQLERERLELQKGQFELQTRRIDLALQTAHRVMSMLPPDIDSQTKTTLLQTLLPDLLPPGIQALEPPTTSKELK